ncbi:MAG: hypothetical protein WDN48_07540 [Pseudolabrys sp.]
MVASATPPLKITGRGSRVTATIEVALPAKPQTVKLASHGAAKVKTAAGVPVIMKPEKAAAGATQFAASKHKTDKHKLQKVAAR